MNYSITDVQRERSNAQVTFQFRQLTIYGNDRLHYRALLAPTQWDGVNNLALILMRTN